MAGGEGERLRPLTCTIPKPMALLLDKPILSYSMELLKKHGVERAGITLRYLPDEIESAFGDGSEDGIQLRYYTETRPLGTAGSVRAAREFLNETFCVLSGDGITDANLTEALAFHREKNALATIIVKRMPNPTEYGLVTLAEDGRIERFTEKPSWKYVTSDLVNTGIYIFEPEILTYIPDDRPYDFGKELFPRLLEAGEPIFGFETDAYWCDIGDFTAYLRAQEDALNGKIALIPAPQNGIFRMPGAVVDEDAQIEAPVFIGARARIHRGAKILAGSVIGSGATVGEYASVKRGVILPNAVIQRRAEIRGAVVCAGAIVGEDARVFEEAVVGAGTSLADRVCVKPGAKIWPGKRIPYGANVSENLVWGQRGARSFDGALICARTPEDAVRAGRAIAWKLKPQRILVGRSPSAVAAAQERALVSGLASQGAQVYTVGECSLPQLRFLVGNMRLDGGAYVASDAISPILSDGTPLSPAERRGIESALNRLDIPQPFSGITRPVINAGRGDLSYLGFLQSASFGSIRRLSAAIYAPTEPTLYLAEQAFSQCGIPARVEWEEERMELNHGEVGVYLSESGEDARFADEYGPLPEPMNELLIAWAIAEAGEKTLFAPPESTRALEGFTKSLGIEVVFLRDDTAPWEKTLREKSEYQFHMRRDGIFCALNVMCRLGEKELSLSSFRERMPRTERVTRDIEIDFPLRGEAFRHLREFAPDDYEREDCFFRGKNGCAWVRADETRPVCTVTAEARDTEFANEICDLFSNLLLRKE